MDDLNTPKKTCPPDEADPHIGPWISQCYVWALSVLERGSLKRHSWVVFSPKWVVSHEGLCLNDPALLADEYTVRGGCKTRVHNWFANLTATTRTLAISPGQLSLNNVAYSVQTHWDSTYCWCTIVRGSKTWKKAVKLKSRPRGSWNTCLHAAKKPANHSAQQFVFGSSKARGPCHRAGTGRGGGNRMPSESSIPVTPAWLVSGNTSSNNGLRFV